MPRVALVTGGNQGLGLALVRGLRDAMGEGDVVYLTARDAAKGAGAAQALRAGGDAAADLAVERLDVAAPDAPAALARTLIERHGGVDVVISNAAARISRDDPAAQVRAFAETNNRGTRRMLDAFLPALRPGGRFLTITSGFGRLRHLDAPLGDRFDVLDPDAVDAVVDAWVEDVEQGRAAAVGWPEWINIPSKIGQTALARAAQAALDGDRPGDGIRVHAVCPGLVDTEASRPWFDDMSRAQTPDAAAAHVIRLALARPEDAPAGGELVQFGDVLPWRE